MARAWYDFLLALFPFSCHVCGRRSGWREVLCGDCREIIRKNLFAPRRVCDVVATVPIWTVSSYSGVPAQAVKAAKYKPSRRLAEHLSELFYDVLTASTTGSGGDVVVPVPLHEAREARRGFNQARILAEGVAKAWQCPLSPAIVRRWATRPQAECSEDERPTNLKGVFALHPDLQKNLLVGKRIWLIDDVATTGHTLEECSLPFREAQVAEVSCLVFSHSYREFPALPSPESGKRKAE